MPTKIRRSSPDISNSERIRLKLTLVTSEVKDFYSTKKARDAAQSTKNKS